MDADEATSALIAKMLSEDGGSNPYYDNPYGGAGYEEDEGSDYEFGESKKKKGGAKKAKAPAKPKASKAKAKKEDEDDEDTEELTATGRRKRKDTGQNRKASRAWSDDEEKLFVEALRLHGRNWKEAAAHVGTRDARAFTSHAQKYFIKLCLQGRPLPQKVKESGEGYTLSGKALDPHSAAARAYGFKESTL
eukprot:CAMPEP_0198203534 /NCGR_PEP_ID=MMETSP1445-20131203/6834_1 /TAXON_ID=36898 /ORGANISM="Pyramimonas sp., Strain CCMP2087" /LENGTH=191 /DNA_ID=CAMNT_0043874969 /DNA_START=28 /DNA_END=600 /DNA_ORIENTATION=-